MTGAVPCTKWLDGCIALDPQGFVKTGSDLSKGEHPPGHRDRQRLLRPGLHPVPAVAGLLRDKSGDPLLLAIAARQLEGTSVTVIELAPPGVETPLFRGEFEEELKGQKGMDVTVLARRAIADIEAGKLEIRPGLSKVLSAMSRIAPHFMLNQMARMSRPKAR